MWVFSFKLLCQEKETFAWVEQREKETENGFIKLVK